MKNLVENNFVHYAISAMHSFMFNVIILDIDLNNLSYNDLRSYFNLHNWYQSLVALDLRSTRFLILSFFEITQSGESLSIHITFSFTFNTQQEMDHQYPTVAKIPVLDTGKFKQWQFRIQQYLQHEHYALKYKIARELWAVILKTFGGNEATKKTKKNLLKQQYGNFKAEGSETLEQMFNRLQTIVWRNRNDLDTMSLDDLYNHLKSYMANEEEDHALVTDEVIPTEFALMANTSAESKTGLPECADDIVTDYSRPSPTVESTSEDDQNRNPSVFKNVASPITPKPFIKFVKPKDSQSESKTDKKETPKKPPVKYAEQYIKPNKKPNVRGNQRN
nr:hypothetical protein [Tanacetum cinerariifolium]